MDDDNRNIEKHRTILKNYNNSYENYRNNHYGNENYENYEKIMGKIIGMAQL